MKQYSVFIILILFVIEIQVHTSCANIIPPTGGPRDSFPPVLMYASPKDSSTNFNTNRITLSFDEYVTVDNVQENLVVSPNPKLPPLVESKLTRVTIKLKDTLEPNTTYSLNFGKAIKDVNEGNSNPNFTYVFSTGGKIDYNTLSGKVILAENGKADSTLIVVLHSNLDDSAIAKERPRYYTKLDSSGNFTFHFLPAQTFAVYVIPNDYSKKYDDSTKLFAFADKPVTVSDTNTTPLTLYAYQLIKEKAKTTPTGAPITAAGSNKKPDKKNEEDRRLRIAPGFANGQQDILSNLELTFSQPVKNFDTSKLHLSDTSYNRIHNYKLSWDTTNTKLTLNYVWPENTPYKLVIEKTFITDTTNYKLAKNDTISFSTKRESDYGSVRLRFRDLDMQRNPVLQLVQSDRTIDSIQLQQPEWNKKLYAPGEYEMRILYDDNKNGKWDPGSFFGVKKQPEIAQQIYKKLTIRANYDNDDVIFINEKPPARKLPAPQPPVRRK